MDDMQYVRKRRLSGRCPIFTHHEWKNDTRWSHWKRTVLTVNHLKLDVNKRKPFIYTRESISEAFINARFCQSAELERYIFKKMMILTFFLGLLNFAAAEAQSEQVSFRQIKNFTVIFRTSLEALKTTSSQWKRLTTTCLHRSRSTLFSDDPSDSTNFELEKVHSFCQYRVSCMLPHIIFKLRIK